MRCVAGTIYNPGEQPLRGYVCWEEGVIREVAPGNPPQEPEAEGIITPLFINGHTHIADSCLFGMVDLDQKLKDIVDPPHGTKHRLLATIPDDSLINGMIDSLHTMFTSGYGAFLDFREGGILGINLLQRAFNGFSEETFLSIPYPIVLSRPRCLEYDRDEITALLEHSAGLGISAMMDWDYPELEKVASEVRRSGKLFVLHASETVREDIDMILDLKPDILIHLTAAKPSDLELVADRGIEVVICPRSNALFGFLPDIPLMLEKGLSLTLGTDNLMFSSPDCFRELDFAWRIGRYQGRKVNSILSPDEILAMAGSHIKKALNVKSGVSQDNKASFMVLSNPSIEHEFVATSIIHSGRISMIVDGKSHWEVP